MNERELLTRDREQLIEMCDNAWLACVRHAGDKLQDKMMQHDALKRAVEAIDAKLAA